MLGLPDGRVCLRLFSPQVDTISLTSRVLDAFLEIRVEIAHFEVGSGQVLASVRMARI